MAAAISLLALFGWLAAITYTACFLGFVWLSAKTINRPNHDIRQRNERLDILAEAAALLLTSETPERIVQSLGEKVMKHLGCQAFFNYLVEDGKESMRLNAWAGIPEKAAREIERIEFGAAVCGCVAREGRRIIAEDIANAPDKRTDLVRSFGIQAYACHPLICQGRVIGTLSFGTAARPRFGAEELALMKAVADLAATAMARKRAETALAHSEQRVRIKLESLLSPEGDIAGLELSDIIDAPAIQKMMDDFHKFACIPMAVIDVKGKVLVGVGWQDICTKFHRAHPETCRNCVESDTQLSAGVAPGEYRLYKCKNNMWDVATPIIVGGKHVGNVFSGQFFFSDESPDRELFRQQAGRYGFPESEYLAALDRVPRLSRAQVDAAMGFFLKLAHNISRMSWNNIQLARETNERKRTEEALRRNEDRLARTQEIAHLGGWELDLVNNELSWSDEAYRIFGLQPQAFGATYEAFLAAVHPDDRAAVDAAYSGSLRDGRDSYDIEHRIVRSATGEIRFVHEKCEHIRDGAGRIIRSLGMVQDITERKKAEGVEQARLRLLVAASPKTVPLEDTLRIALDEIEALSGSSLGFYHFLDEDQQTLSLQTWSTNTLKAMGAAEGKDSRYPLAEAGAWAECVRERRPVIHNDYAALPRRKGLPPGHTPVLRELTVPIMRGGRIVAVIGVGNKPTDYQAADAEIASRLGDLSWEIIERKKAEAALRRSHECLEARVAQRTEELARANEKLKQAEALQRAASAYTRSLIETSLDPLVTISPRGKITDVNEATVKATGIARERIIGTDFSDYFTEPEQARAGYRRVFAQGFVTDYPLTIRHKDGGLTDVLYNASVYRDAQGEVIGVFAAARDITRRKAAEQRLQALMQDLKRSNRDLEQFAYVASHDLQEPLRMVASFTQLLEKRYRDKLDQEGREFIGFAVDGATRMQRLINDLLSYARVSSRGRPASAVDARAALGEALANLSPAIQEAGAMVTNDDLPTVWADYGQLVQVFQNLIGNAVKFRGQKSPRVHVRARQDGRQMIFSVQDNGIGIAPEFLERIFVIFQRLHGQAKYPGTGIGLALCKKIVERHGGNIWVQSQPDQGSTFHFSIPAPGG